jgi:DNA-directed RNA polymerase subunit RPC12/RpoP
MSTAMQQKLCATCSKELTPSERARNEIQCAECYLHWLKGSVQQAEPLIRQILQEIEIEKQSGSGR